MKAYCNGRIFTGEKFVKNACILVKNNKIVEIFDKNNLPSDAEVIDLKGNIIAPAFIDLQIYGGNGALFGEHPSVKALEATYNYCLSGGTAYFMPTVATHSEKTMFDAIDAVKLYQNQGKKGVLGLHLEGPYINTKKRGAHLKQLKTVGRHKIIQFFLIGKNNKRTFGSNLFNHFLAPIFIMPKLLKFCQFISKKLP